MLALVLGLIAAQEAGRKGGWASCAIREGVPRLGNSLWLGIFFPFSSPRFTYDVCMNEGICWTDGY